MVRQTLISRVVLVALVIGLAGCSALQERVAGPSDSGGGDVDGLELEASLEPGEGIGGGALEPEDIGTAIQLTLEAAFTATPETEPTTSDASPTNTLAAATATPIPATSTPGSTPTVPGAQFTQLADTLRTLTAIVSSSTPTTGATSESTPDEDSGGTATPEPDGFTPSPSPTQGSVTPTPNPTQAAIAARPCLALRFVTDVTIPDGTPVQPGSTFFKSWYVQNVGSCRWTPDFSLAFSSGVQMGTNTSYALGTFVNPDQFVTLTAQMNAPQTPGYHTSYWGLEDAEGTFFGWSSDGGETFDQPFYALIFVLGSSQSSGIGTGAVPGVVVTSPPFTPGP